MDRSRASKTLANNINLLMKDRLDLDSNPKLSKRSGLPVSTLSRLRNGKVEATLQVLERLAGAFEVAPSLLISNDPPAWPFARVDIVRVLSLDPGDRAYVEGKLEAAIEHCEKPTEQDRELFRAAHQIGAEKPKKAPKKMAQ